MELEGYALQPAHMFDPAHSHHTSRIALPDTRLRDALILAPGVGMMGVWITDRAAFVPELPGLGVTGATREEYEELIEEGIPFHLEGCWSDEGQ
jgi:hypothetical protein